VNDLKMTDAVGLIDDRLISGAIAYQGSGKRPGRVKWGALAACLCLAAIGAAALWDRGSRSVSCAAEPTAPAAVIQVSLSKTASVSEGGAEAAIRFVSAGDGLFLAADGEAAGDVAGFVAPDDAQDHRGESMSREEAEALAYLDPDSAEGEMKDRILEARRIIIFSTSWVADGYSGCVQNVKTGEIIRTLPTFSELFPGWELPVLPDTKDRITADGLGADCLYGLTIRILAVNEIGVTGVSLEPMNMFGTDREITVYLPEGTTAGDLGLKSGDTVFVSYYGSSCSLSEGSIRAYGIKKTD
jgi:hypothetical protein